MKVVFMASAEKDLDDLRQYVLKNFGESAWREARRRVRDSIRTIQAYPQSGAIPVELVRLGYQQYRQATADLNRIIYEVRDEVILVHIVCDGRRDMRTLMSRRLVRVSAVNDPRLPYHRMGRLAGEAPGRSAAG